MTMPRRGASAVLKTIRRWLPYLVIFAVSASIYLLHGFERAEYRLMDYRFQLTSRAASGDLVLVAIDAESLKELDRWPWPRDYHATVIRRLIEDGADRIAFAVDFSSRSSKADDLALRDALAFAADKGRPVILPLFKQFKDSLDPGSGLVLTEPLPMFSEHADPAFTNVRPAQDSLIRRIQIADEWNGRHYLTLAARLVGMTNEKHTLFYVDYGIDASSIPKVSYSDLYFGRVDPGVFKGKKVLVGATAVELGDQMAVPRYRSMPAPLVEALSFESIVQGRLINRLGPLPVLAVSLVILLFGGTWLVSLAWRRGLIVLAGFASLCFGGSIAVQTAFPISVDLLPWVVPAAMAFLFGLIRKIDRQVFQAFISGMAVTHTRAVMRGMIENSFDGVIVVNSRGTIEMFNPAAERMFKLDSQDVLGQSVEAFFTSEGGAETARQIEEMLGEMEKPKPDRSSGRLREMDLGRRDGTVFPAEVAISRTALRVSGRNPQERRTLQRGAFVYIIRDISERREADRKERQLRSQLASAARLTTMGEMAAGIAHEINQPLTAINTYASGLLNLSESGSTDAVELQVNLKRISEQAQRAAGIIRRIRGIAKKEEQERQAVAVNPAVSEAIDLVLADANGHQDIKIIRELGPNLPLIWADTVQIQQVVVNLMRNAVDAVTAVCGDDTGPRDRRIRVMTRRADDHYVQIIVNDSGHGIPVDLMPRLFEPFFSTKSSGMGIGLLMCKSIVDDHEGEIRIESVEGLGTTVSFTVPTVSAR